MQPAKRKKKDLLDGFGMNGPDRSNACRTRKTIDDQRIRMIKRSKEKKKTEQEIYLVLLVVSSSRLLHQLHWRTGRASENLPLRRERVNRAAHHIDVEIVVVVASTGVLDHDSGQVGTAAVVGRVVDDGAAAAALSGPGDGPAACPRDLGVRAIRRRGDGDWRCWVVGCRRVVRRNALLLCA